MSHPVQPVDEQRLEADLAYRFKYLSEFMGFGPEDVQAIRTIAPRLLPLVPVFVDAVYVKLFHYDATKRHFVPQQTGYEGPIPSGMDALSLEHEVVRFRKKHLANYFTKLLGGNFDGKMVDYLDFVGRMHTPRGGNKQLHIPLVQMDALMGFVADALLATILGFDLDQETRTRAVRAFNKLLWLQHDLIARHQVG